MCIYPYQRAAIIAKLKSIMKTLKCRLLGNRTIASQSTLGHIPCKCKQMLRHICEDHKCNWFALPAIQLLPPTSTVALSFEQNQTETQQSALFELAAGLALIEICDIFAFLIAEQSNNSAISTQKAETGVSYDP